MVTYGKNNFDFYSDMVQHTLIKLSIDTTNFFAIKRSKREHPKLSDFPFIKTDDPSQSMTKVHKQLGKSVLDERALTENFKYTSSETPWSHKEWWSNIVQSTIRMSPSHFLRCCGFLCETGIPAITESLFDTAFLLCWIYMQAKSRRTVSGCLTVACLSDTLPNSNRES